MRTRLESSQPEFGVSVVRDVIVEILGAQSGPSTRCRHLTIHFVPSVIANGREAKNVCGVVVFTAIAFIKSLIAAPETHKTGGRAFALCLRGHSWAAKAAFRNTREINPKPFEDT